MMAQNFMDKLTVEHLAYEFRRFELWCLKSNIPLYHTLDTFYSQLISTELLHDVKEFYYNFVVSQRSAVTDNLDVNED